MSRKESFTRDNNGRITQKTVTWTGAGKSDHYRVYTGTRTPSQKTGTTTHHGSRSTHNR